MQQDGHGKPCLAHAPSVPEEYSPSPLYDSPGLLTEFTETAQTGTRKAEPGIASKDAPYPAFIAYTNKMFSRGKGKAPCSSYANLSTCAPTTCTKGLQSLRRPLPVRGQEGFAFIVWPADGGQEVVVSLH